MNRVSRAAVAGVLAAALACGGAAPAAFAAPKASHAKVHHHKSMKAKGHVHKAKDHGRKAKSDRMSPAHRRLAKHAAHKVAYLERVAESRKVERLGDDVQAAVLENIAGDIAEIGELKDAMSGVSRAELRDEAKSLRSYRPEVYRTIVNQLRLSTRLQLRAEGTAEADALDALLATLMGYDAETKRSDLRATQRVITSVKEALEESEDSEADETSDESSDESSETDADPGTTEP